MGATALIEAGLAVVVAALAGRGRRGRLPAFALAVPFAALGWPAIALTGYGAR